MNENLKALLDNADVETLKTLVLIADDVILAQHAQLEVAAENVADLHEDLCEVVQEADRYQLLKRQLRDLLVIAAYSGAQFGHVAVEKFRSFDVEVLDETLDVLIDNGVLDALYDLEDEQAAEQFAAQGDEPFCGDPECEQCHPELIAQSLGFACSAEL